jgi:hypothetical protein
MRLRSQQQQLLDRELQTRCAAAKKVLAAREIGSLCFSVIIVCVLRNETAALDCDNGDAMKSDIFCSDVS